jgi:hypothetical protein
MQTTEAQRKAYAKLKEEGELQGCDTLTRSKLNGELYFKCSEGSKIVAIHKSGIVTIHQHNKVNNNT